ncbi:MAG: hypothetical protein LBD23_18790, partial [Oscillospiraceae bacterium]|nr:hypothetical protein [Oscillospiraceae bacterium]
MKKILSFILIIVISIIFAISVSARTPPPRVIIRSEDELIELRRIAEAGEEAFTRSGHRELITYGEVISFLVLVDSLLIPHGEGMRFTGLIYSPGNNYYHIFFESRGDERHSYYFDLSEERGEGIVERMFGSVVSLLYENKDEGLRVYSPPPSWGSFPDETGGYRFAMEINGFFMRAGYSPGRSSTHVTAESVYGGMTVTTIRDLTWIDRNQPGDIF